MKRILYRFCTIICVALAFCFITLSAYAESANLYQVACTADGNPWSMAILVEFGGAAYAYTTYIDTGTSDMNYLYDLNNESEYEMNWIESVEDISVWRVLDYDGSPLLTAAAPRKNETVTAYYFNSEGTVSKTQRVIADMVKLYDDGTAIIELNSEISDLTSGFGPGFLINADNRCVGIMCASQKGAYVAWFDKSSFSGSPGVPWLTFILIGVAGAGIGLYLKKKNGEQSRVNSELQNQDTGQFISYEEIEQPPIPLDISGEWQPVAPDTGGALFLVCSGGHMDGRIYPINTDIILMGRDPSCAIKYPFDYKGISRQHARLCRQNGALTLMDTSSYGTYLKRIGGKIAPKQPISVGVGDVFYLGERKNRFEIVRR